MIGPHVEETIIVVAIVLWFAHGWYLNERLINVHKKLDQILEQFNGLREYLYEVDPQFNDERAAAEDWRDPSHNEFSRGFAAMEETELLKNKENARKRTLNTRF